MVWYGLWEKARSQVSLLRFLACTVEKMFLLTWQEKFVDKSVIGGD